MLLLLSYNKVITESYIPFQRLFSRYRDLAPQLVPLDYTDQPDVKLPYELIGSMPELKVGPVPHTHPHTHTHTHTHTADPLSRVVNT